MGQSGSVCVHSNSHPDKRDPGSESSVPVDDHHSSGLALVLRSGGVVIPDTSVPSNQSRSPDPPTQGSTEHEPACLAPGAKAIWEQGSSAQVATRIEAPQRQSTRFIYKAKWSVLLDSFHRDRPTGRQGIPSWNLSLVLHQLTKAPFEPLWKASLKHLTFKMVFLLALGSGKRRSEIHT